MGKLSFGATGISYQCDKVELKTEGAPRCPRCQQRVYFNEERKALGKSWHTKCFNCAKCRKSLDSTNCNGHEGEIFCTACHRREFGPKGYGFAGGAAGLSTESDRHNVRPVKTAQAQAVPSHAPATSLDYSNPECCPRCGKRVYFAEEMKAQHRKWHKLCFKCYECNKLLDTGRFSTHNMELFCQACYGRRHGPKGYGFAGGAGNLLSSELDKYHPHHPDYRRPLQHSQQQQQQPQQQQQQQQQELVPRVNPHRASGGGSTDSDRDTPSPVRSRDVDEWTEAVYI